MTAASDLIEQRWIPVTERMPKHLEMVRISLDRGNGPEPVKGYHSDTLNCWAVDIGLHHESLVTHWQPQPAPEPSTGLLIPSDPLQAARLRKCLAKPYFFNNRLATLGEFLANVTPTYRHHSVRKYARKKRQGCYALLAKLVHEYSVWYETDDDPRPSGFGVPKLVFDALIHLPIKVSVER